MLVKLNPNGLAVEFTGKVQNPGFYCHTAAVDCGPRAHIGDRQMGLTVHIDLCGVDAVGRLQYALRHMQVGSGNSNGAAHLGPRYHLAAEQMGMAQKTVGLLQVSRRDELADIGGGDCNAIQ